MVAQENRASLRAPLGNLKLVSAGLGDGRINSQVLADALWTRLRQEAQEALVNAPMLAPLFTEADDVIYSGSARAGIDLHEWDRRAREMLQPVRS